MVGVRLEFNLNWFNPSGGYVMEYCKYSLKKSKRVRNLTFFLPSTNASSFSFSRKIPQKRSGKFKR